MHQNKHQNTYKQHVPVLLDEVLLYLDPKPGESYLDVTAGYAGHASAILERTGNLPPTSATSTQSTLVDRDSQAIAVLKEKFGEQGPTLLHTNFLRASEDLHVAGKQFDMILADLGVSSPHLNEDNRGFSMKSQGPLDMRMDQDQAVTAAIILNTYSEERLADLLKKYGEEPKARQIAAGIVQARPLTTASQLAIIAQQAWPGYSRIHPATRTFQAIRIAVNDELGLLEKALPLWIQLLKPGGRLAVISFHSLEDRLVKQAFKEAGGEGYDAVLRLLTKRPITASSSEVVSNPRARSAKLRVSQRK